MTVTRYPPGQRKSLKEQLLGVMGQPPSPVPELAPAAAPEPASTAVAAPIASRVAMKINPNLKGRMARMRPQSSEARSARHAINVFSPAKLPPGVGTKDTKIAMDSALQTWAQDSFQASWEANNGFGSAFIEGVTFLGFTYLAELTQRPEFRRISERIGTEMTRKWIKLTTAEADDEKIEGELEEDEDDIRALIGADRSAAAAEEDDAGEGQPVDDDSSSDQPEEDPEQEQRSSELKQKIKEIDEELKRFGIRDKFGKLAEHDGWYGRAHLYIDTGHGEDPEELITDLGDGTEETTGSKLKQGQLKGFKVVEPMWCYPLQYNSSDPLSDDWYNPPIWLSMQKQIHVSRLMVMVGREVPDILKPAYAFAGLSMSQMAKPYVDNWLRTRQAVTNLIESFSVSGVYTNAQSLLQGGGEEVLDRIEIFNLTRTNAGTMVLDKETEEFFNVSTPLGTLDHLQAQSQEQMSSVSGIPLIVLLGITPTGLNASSEGELRVFYDLINAFQEKLFRGPLTKVINLIQLNKWGSIDPEIGFEFEPLWSLDEKGQAEVDKTKAETHTVYIDAGVVSPEEVRGILISDPGLPYTGLDPNDIPEPPAEEGLLMPGGMGGGGENDGGGAGREPADAGGAQDRLKVREVAPGVFAFDEWNEADHPRGQPGNSGQFGPGGSGSSAEGGSFKTKREHIAHLLKHGTTPKELMSKMGWPSVSMPAQAKSLGMKLEKRDGRYYGTPLTDEEKAAAEQDASSEAGESNVNNRSVSAKPSKALQAAAAHAKVPFALRVASAERSVFESADKRMQAVVNHINKLLMRRDDILPVDSPEGHSSFSDLLTEEGYDRGDIDSIRSAAREAAREKLNNSEIAPELSSEDRNELSAEDIAEFDMIGSRLKGLYAVAKERAKELAKATIPYERAVNTALEKIEILAEAIEEAVPPTQWEPWLAAANSMQNVSDTKEIGELLDYLEGKEAAPSVEELVELHYDEADWDALPEEEQERIKEKQREEAETADREKTKEVHSNVDKAIAGGWWPSIEDGHIILGKNVPEELKQYASPKSQKAIRERIAQHLMGEVEKK